MKKIVSFLSGSIVLLWVSLGCAAQYAVNPVPPPSVFSFNDLWHFTVSRAGAGGQDLFYISLRVFGPSHNLQVKSNSTTFSLESGTRYFSLAQISELQPFSTSYYDAPLLQQAIASGGTFPPGSYLLSYTLYGKQADGVFEPLSESTSEATVEALWPPMLLSPADGELIYTSTPLLTWTPAFSSGYTGSVSYSLRLAEVFPGQNGYQALQANPAYFSQSNLPVTTLPYPPAAPVLDSGKTYAWQVYADAGGVSLGSSEIWTFRLGTPQNEADPVSKKPFFIVSKIRNSQTVEVSGGILRLAFEEELYDRDQRLTFRILDKQRRTVADQNRLTRIVRTGHNKISLSLCGNPGGFNLPKGYYSIEIVSQRGEVYVLNFHHNKTGTGCGEQ